MKQQAFVTDLIDEDAMVSGERESACSGCAGKNSCSTLGSWNSRSVSMRVHNSVGALPGDTVEIEVDDHLMLKASFRLYALPLLVFLMFGGVGWWLAGWLSLSADPIAICVGLLALAGCYGWIRYQDQFMPETLASITRILD